VIKIISALSDAYWIVFFISVMSSPMAQVKTTGMETVSSRLCSQLLFVSTVLPFKSSLPTLIIAALAIFLFYSDSN
jgi:hypothetical protein